MASEAEELSGSVTDPALLPSSSSRNARLRADEELIHTMTKAVNELRLEWSPLRSHLAAGWTSVFSQTWQTWLYTPPKPPPIGHSMSRLIVLERHLWLTMTEMKEADKVPFLDAPVSSGSLFGPSVEGMLNASRRLRRHLRRCKTSSLSAPALLLLPVATRPAPN